jgi:streptogramin lyase
MVQEVHDAYKVSNNQEDNEVRSIAIDKTANVWIATASGVFCKMAGTREWKPVISGEERGPAYSIVVNPDGAVVMGTWNGIFRFRDQKLTKEEGVMPPISVVCNDGESNYALGPYGIWRFKNGKWEQQEYKIARSVRNAIVDDKGNLWVATDAGLYKCRDGKSKLYQDVSELISCYARAISVDPSGNIWTGVMGGVSVRNSEHLIKNITPKEGLSSILVNCIKQSPDGVMWVGTDVGVVRFAKDGTHSLRFSRRWLTNDKVTDIAFDAQGNAWVATADGVSEIKRNMMTLADKEKNFYSQLMRRHIRDPWICGVVNLEIPGDTASWHHSDDDNDGEYTGGYLAMESFRYAVTKDEDARIKARKAFGFLKLLQEVTETEGFFARSVVPVDSKYFHDGNRTYTPKQIADELIKDPRYKPVEKRWHKSKDGKWLWKGDTSSDEMDGHMMGYFYYYELVAGENEKALIRDHVRKIVDYLIKYNYNFMDIDGTHTHWAVWSPDQLNHDPDWASERSINSFELLAYLKLAGHMTGDGKYEKEYRRLIEKEGYLDNVSHLNSKNPAWQIYFDRTMEGYLFPILVRYENDPKLKAFYKKLINEWMNHQKSGENLINNLSYAFATGKKVNVPQTIEFLRDAPLDLVDWPINHTLREDVKLVRSPIMEDVQVSELPPASIRSTVRWDKNPWAAIQGDPQQEREPVFWLWPYWMARYLQIIQK